ncbi:hypothetical protein DH2020_014314 [Rehmannia glutinosa]|uniref:Heparanase-like protein n=1 Tax=Rehmannia glutinosa TaxID=99300 RepID=A0ABR0WZF2_REHGL
MGCLVLRKGWWLLCVFYCCSFICDVKAINGTVEITVFINGTSPIAKTDEDFICATLDWWPPEKCDYGTCAWGQASLLNLPNNIATGPWDSTNAASLIRYTVTKGYKIYGWELGNELSGSGIGVGIAVDPYATDTIVLHNLIQDIYKGINTKPQIIAPGGFFDPGSDEHLIDRILNPSVLDSGADVFRNVHNVVRTSINSAVAWVGKLEELTIAAAIKYLDQLGLASTYDTKTYCRQTLIGGNYGLLNTTTFVPNPDYYSALLWHRLMGRQVLSTNFTGTRSIRAYAHCAKQSGTYPLQQGITLLLINIDGNTTVQTRVEFQGTLMRLHKRRHHHRHRPKVNPLHQRKQAFGSVREEYHLTPSDGNIQSQTVLLNRKPLTVDPSSGLIPALEPVRVNSSEPITVAPYSIVFVRMPCVAIPACR